MTTHGHRGRRGGGSGCSKAGSGAAAAGGPEVGAVAAGRVGSVVSTVVLTLVFVGGSVAAVAVVLLRDESQPATQTPKSERVWLDRRLDDLWAAVRRWASAVGARFQNWSDRRPDRIVAKVERREQRAIVRHERRVTRADDRRTRANDRAQQAAAAATARAAEAPEPGRVTSVEGSSVTGIDPRLQQLVDDGAVAVAELVEPGDPVSPRPGFWRRLRASVGLMAVIIAIGVALTALVAIAGVLIARTLESAVS